VINAFQSYLDFQGFRTIHKNVFTAPKRRSSTVNKSSQNITSLTKRK